MVDFDIGSSLTLPLGRRHIPRLVVKDRAPTDQDWRNFARFDRWLDTSDNTVYTLVSIAKQSAEWKRDGSGAVFQLVPGSDDPVDPNDAGQIHFVEGDGISITKDNADSIRVSSAEHPERSQWTNLVEDTTIEDKHGYFVNGGSRLVLTLPEESNENFSFQVIDWSGNGFEIAQNDGQSIRVGNQVTTTGTGGKIDSEQQGDWLTFARFSDNEFVAGIVQGSVDIT